MGVRRTAGHAAEEGATDELREREVRAQRRIDRAWYGALIWIVGVAVLGGFAMAAEGEADVGVIAVAADLAAVGALAVGVARRSRLAAALLLAHLLWVNGAIWLERRSPIVLVTLVALGWCYIDGVRGTLAWHRLRREEERRRAGAAPGASPPASRSGA